MKYSHFTLLIATLLLAETAKSQVTIGSNFRPTSAALLQLKNQEADANNVTSTAGGMVLSRVYLENLTTLEPFIKTTVDDYDLLKLSHTGLLVYNVNKTNPFKPGLYIWDGIRWNIMVSSANPNTLPSVTPPTSGDDVQPTIPAFNEGAYLPNSYMVPPGTTVNIPVLKAYSVWKNYLEKDLGIENQTVTAELLWQDEKELVSSVTLDVKSDKYKTLIKVKTNSTMEGNAVVVVKMNGIIRWSWHLWITDYNPESVAFQNKLNENNILMDRYLGATSSDFGHLGAIGLLYQWGRKDPFSGSASTTSAKEKAHYTINNTLITNPVIKEKVANLVNIANTVTNPSVYYTGTTDWYSTSRETFSNNMWVTELGRKGVYDPCPTGWRVPVSEKDEQSVWDKLKGRGKHFDLGKGVAWDDYGYYHASGRRNASGDLELVGREAYVWSAKNFFDDQAYRLNVADWNVYPQHSSNRVFAHSVRCVKDK